MTVRLRSPPGTGESAERSVEEPPARPGPIPDPLLVYAGLVTRAIAIGIDAVLIDVAAVAVAGAVPLVESIFGVSHHHHAAESALAVVLFSVWVISYFGFFWTTTGQTPGNRVMQIRVARPDGTPLRPLRALIRLVGMVLSLPVFWGYLPILWSPRRRGAYDVVAGTVVTVVRPVPGGEQSRAARRSRAHASGIEPPSTVP